MKPLFVTSFLCSFVPSFLLASFINSFFHSFFHSFNYSPSDHTITFQEIILKPNFLFFINSSIYSLLHCQLFHLLNYHSIINQPLPSSSLIPLLITHSLIHTIIIHSDIKKYYHSSCDQPFIQSTIIHSTTCTPNTSIGGAPFLVLLFHHPFYYSFIYITKHLPFIHFSLASSFFIAYSTLLFFNLSTFQPFNPSNPAHSNHPTFESPFDSLLAIQIAFFNLPSIYFAAYPVPLLNSPLPSCLSNTFHPLLQSIFTHHSISHFLHFNYQYHCRYLTSSTSCPVVSGSGTHTMGQ